MRPVRSADGEEPGASALIRDARSCSPPGDATVGDGETSVFNDVSDVSDGTLCERDAAAAPGASTSAVTTGADRCANSAPQRIAYRTRAEPRGTAASRSAATT